MWVWVVTKGSVSVRLGEVKRKRKEESFGGFVPWGEGGVFREGVMQEETREESGRWAEMGNLDRRVARRVLS